MTSVDPISRTIVLPWKSNGISDEKIISIVESSYTTHPILKDDSKKLFYSVLLKQSKITYNYVSAVNIYVAYSLGSGEYTITITTLGKCLFGGSFCDKKWE